MVTTMSLVIVEVVPDVVITAPLLAVEVRVVMLVEAAAEATELEAELEEWTLKWAEICE